MKKLPLPNPSGLCLCGCGQPTRVAKKNVSRLGWVAGMPIRYIWGHKCHEYKRMDSYHEEDRGFTSPCWIWDGHRNDDGYGIITTDEGQRGAHRVYYVRYRGAIPEGLEPDRLCRQRDCVNPWHQEPVTRAENTRRGLSAKLSLEQVEAIRASPLSSRQAARAFSISPSQVKRIRNGQSWA